MSYFNKYVACILLLISHFLFLSYTQSRTHSMYKSHCDKLWFSSCMYIIIDLVQCMLTLSGVSNVLFPYPFFNALALFSALALATLHILPHNNVQKVSMRKLMIIIAEIYMLLVFIALFSGFNILFFLTIDFFFTAASDSASVFGIFILKFLPPPISNSQVCGRTREANLNWKTTKKKLLHSSELCLAQPAQRSNLPSHIRTVFPYSRFSLNLYCSAVLFHW